MTKMIWNKVYRADQIQKMGDDEGAASFGAMARRKRAIIQRDRPDLSAAEIEDLLSRIIRKGLRPTSPPPSKMILARFVPESPTL